MFKKIALPCLLLTGLFATVAEAEKSPPAKVGWVETVKLDLQGWTVLADARLVNGEYKELGTRSLSMLANHLERLTILMPEKQLTELRQPLFPPPPVRSPALSTDFTGKAIS